MPRASKEDVIETLHKFICDTFSLADQEAIRPTDKLFEEGIIDSLSLLEIVDFVEATFNLTVRDDDLVLENFGSVVATADFVIHSLEDCQEG
jgi:acyl carrier protein